MRDMQPGGHNTGNRHFFRVRRAQELDERLRDERLTRFVQVDSSGNIRFRRPGGELRKRRSYRRRNPFGVTETPHQAVLGEPVAVQDLEIDRPFVDVEVDVNARSCAVVNACSTSGR